MAGWLKCTGPGAACRTTGNRCVILKRITYRGRLAEMYRTWGSLQDHRKQLCYLKNEFLCVWQAGENVPDLQQPAGVILDPELSGSRSEMIFSGSTTQPKA